MAGAVILLRAPGDSGSVGSGADVPGAVPRWFRGSAAFLGPQSGFCLPGPCPSASPACAGVFSPTSLRARAAGSLQG